GEPPLRRTLEDDDPLGDAGDGRDELHGAGARAEDGDAPAGHVDVAPPAGGVHAGAGEVGQAGDVGVRRPVEVAGGADHHGGRQRLPGAAGGPDGDRPLPAVVVPDDRLDLPAEPEERPEPVVVGQRYQVTVQLVAPGEIPGPVGPLGEGERVQVAGGVDAAAGIAVLQPGAADLLVLVENGEGDARPLQLDAGAQPGEPAADDD